jgi:iron complex transport system ATP-binding protein
VVVEDLDLEIAAGVLTCLLGPNGSGKSTLLRLAAGLRVPRGGEILLRGRPLDRWTPRERARHVAFLPQHVESVHRHTAGETVALARHPHLGPFGRPGPADRRAVDEAMARTGTLDLAPRPLDQLSGGERQRVLIAAALAQGGEFLLLDEPTASLDLHHQVRLMRLLVELAEAGRTVLCATHDLNLAATFAHRVVLLDRGRIEAEGPPAEVLQAERLARIYGDGIWVGVHPAGVVPVVLPQPPGRSA